MLFFPVKTKIWCSWSIKKNVLISHWDTNSGIWGQCLVTHWNKPMSYCCPRSQHSCGEFNQRVFFVLSLTVSFGGFLQVWRGPKIENSQKICICATEIWFTYLLNHTKLSYYHSYTSIPNCVIPLSTYLSMERPAEVTLPPQAHAGPHEDGE